MKIGKSFILLTLLAFSMLVFASCNSMKKDAKKAAELTNKSIEQMHDLKLKESEKTYKKAQQIVQKYEQKGKWDEFRPLYQQYRDEGKRPSHETD